MVALVGLRFGAVLAATAPVQGHQVKKLVLWDPVVTGAAYISTLRSMQASLMDRLKRLHGNRVQSQSQGMEELIGYTYSDNMIADIEAVNLLNTTEFSAPEIYLVVSDQQVH